MKTRNQLNMKTERFQTLKKRVDNLVSQRDGMQRLFIELSQQCENTQKQNETMENALKTHSD